MPTWGEDSVLAGIATEEEAELLELEPGSPVLHISRRAFCRGERRRGHPQRLPRRPLHPLGAGAAARAPALAQTQSSPIGATAMPAARTPRSGPGRRGRGARRARAAPARRRPGTAASGRWSPAGRPARPGRPAPPRSRGPRPTARATSRGRRALTPGPRRSPGRRRRCSRGRATPGRAPSSRRRGMSR